VTYFKGIIPKLACRNRKIANNFKSSTGISSFS